MNIDFNTRVASNKIDLQTITPVIILFGVPTFISKIHKGKTLSNLTPDFSFDDWFLYILCIGIAILFCKDCINGQSPGKRSLNLQVVNFKTKRIANPIRCLVRDLFMILSPIEAVMLLINPRRRLGDYVAGTEVVPFNSELKQKEINYSQIGISFLIAYILSIIQVVIFSQF